MGQYFHQTKQHWGAHSFFGLFIMLCLVLTQGKTALAKPKPNGTGDIIWGLLIDGSIGIDAGRILSATGDGGAVLAVTTHKPKPSWGDVKLIRVTDSGEIKWEKKFGGINGEAPRSLDMDASGNIIVGGQFKRAYKSSERYKLSSKEHLKLKSEDNRQLLMKLSPDGDMLWEYAKGRIAMGSVNDTCLFADGSMLAVGTAPKSPRGARRTQMTKLSSTGQTVWAKASTERRQPSLSMCETMANGSALIAGYDPSDADDNIYVRKINPAGGLIWENWYGGGTGETDTIEAIGMIDSGGAYLGGDHWDMEKQKTDAFLVRIDDDGKVVWKKNFGTKGHDVINALFVLPDGSVLTGGSISKKCKAKHCKHLMLIDGAGNKVWERTIQPSKKGSIRSVVLAKDGHILIASGAKYEKGKGFRVYLAKLKGFGAP